MSPEPAGPDSLAVFETAARYQMFHAWIVRRGLGGNCWAGRPAAIERDGSSWWGRYCFGVSMLSRLPVSGGSVRYASRWRAFLLGGWSGLSAASLLSQLLSHASSLDQRKKRMAIAPKIHRLPGTHISSPPSF